MKLIGRLVDDYGEDPIGFLLRVGLVSLAIFVLVFVFLIGAFR